MWRIPASLSDAPCTDRSGGRVSSADVTLDLSELLEHLPDQRALEARPGLDLIALH
jgi:hypothetical protein